MPHGVDQTEAMLSPPGLVVPVGAQRPRSAQLTVAQIVSLCVGLLTIWLLSHFYRGLEHDGQLYAFQALARLKPELYGGDLFLFAGSQDKYTLFTPLYAYLIRTMGVAQAAALLFIASQLILAASCWWIVRRLISPQAAFFAVAIFIVMPTYYGGRDVFKVAEEFLSARLPAEALSLAAIALFLHERRILAVVSAAVAMAIHPLMACPCVIVLILLFAPQKRWPMLIGIAGAGFAVALLCAHLTPFGPIRIMDAQWFHIVRERSDHLFVTDWWAGDWHRLTLVLATLAYAVLAYPANDPLRRTLLAAICVGVAGVLLTAMGQATTMALLLMGQPWRWLWLPTVLAILFAGPAAYQAAKHSQIGCASAALLLSAWAMMDFAGGVLGLLALGIWAFRDRISPDHRRYAIGVGVAGVAITILWAGTNAAQSLLTSFSVGIEPLWIERLRNVVSQTLPGALLGAGFFYLVMFRWLKISTLATVFAFTVTLGFLLPRLVVVLSTPPFYQKFERERSGFEQWQRIIPPGANVFWNGGHLSVWMLLERPSYLSRTSAAGVVFSRETAMEVWRRALQIDPFIDARIIVDGYEAGDQFVMRQLTPTILKQICSDPMLGFVVSPVHLGFGIPNRSRSPEYHRAELYDCRAIPADS